MNIPKYIQIFSSSGNIEIYNVVGLNSFGEMNFLQYKKNGDGIKRINLDFVCLDGEFDSDKHQAVALLNPSDYYIYNTKVIPKSEPFTERVDAKGEVHYIRNPFYNPRGGSFDVIIELSPKAIYTLEHLKDSKYSIINPREVTSLEEDRKVDIQDFSTDVSEDNSNDVSRGLGVEVRHNEVDIQDFPTDVSEDNSRDISRGLGAEVRSNQVDIPDFPTDVSKDNSKDHTRGLGASTDSRGVLKISGFPTDISEDTSKDYTRGLGVGKSETDDEKFIRSLVKRYKRVKVSIPFDIEIEIPQKEIVDILRNSIDEVDEDFFIKCIDGLVDTNLIKEAFLNSIKEHYFQSSEEE